MKTPKLFITLRNSLKIRDKLNFRKTAGLSILVATLGLLSCSSENDNSSSDIDSPIIGNSKPNTGGGSTPTGGNSNVTYIDNGKLIASELVRLDHALEQGNQQLIDYVNQIRGSVGTFRSGSKVIWSRKNSARLGLYVSALHVYGVDSWPHYDEEYIDLHVHNNGIYGSSHLSDQIGSINIFNKLVADFALYHPEIPINTTNTNILPRNDFYLGVIDGQRIIPLNYGLAVYPDNIELTLPVDIYDPNGRTLATQTWDEAVAGETVYALGYPQDRENYPFGAISKGIVLSDEAARETITLLSQLGDEEGGIPYEPEVEMLITAKSVVGMSGGGVFNSEGQLLGIIVRSTEIDGKPIVRVVRLKYIKDTFEAYFNTLYQDQKDYLRLFIGEEIE